MAFCKVCSCGEKIVFARRMSYPDNCPNCGRRIADFNTYLEDDPQVEDLLKKALAEKSADLQQKDSEIIETEAPHEKAYTLRLPNGKDIVIPPEGGIVGRTELGGEELAEYPSVSRKHLKITPRRNIGLIVEDISTYGTLINGSRVEKNSPVLVTGDAAITLCNVDAHLLVKE